jgi:membrane protein
VKIVDFFNDLVYRVTHHPWWEAFLRWTRASTLPGLQGVPLAQLIAFIDKETRDDALTTRANSMAYSFFLAIFPAIIVLFTLLAYTPLYENFDDLLSEAIHDVMPGDAGQMLFKTIQDIATIPRGGLLSAGFFLSIWFASNGMLSMMRGLEKDYPSTFKRRTAYEKRLIAIQLTFLVVFVLVASVVLIILGNLLLNLLFSYVKVDFLTRFIVFSFRWVVVLLLFYATFSTIYRNFGNFNKLYGSIGTLIVLMIWIQLNCLILLIGFELNAGIAVLKSPTKTTKDSKKQ